MTSQSLPPAMSFLQERVYLLRVPQAPRTAPPTGDRVFVRHGPMKDIMHSKHHSLCMLDLVLTNVDFCVFLRLWWKSQLFFTEENTKAEAGDWLHFSLGRTQRPCSAHSSMKKNFELIYFKAINHQTLQYTSVCSLPHTKACKVPTCACICTHVHRDILHTNICKHTVLVNIATELGTPRSSDVVSPLPMSAQMPNNTGS